MNERRAKYGTDSANGKPIMKRTLRKAASYLLVSLAAWLVGTVGARAETIKELSICGLQPANNTSRLEPIRFCKVEVWGFRPRGLLWLWGKDADTTY